MTEDAKAVTAVGVAVLAFIGLAHLLEVRVTTLAEIAIAIGIVTYCTYALINFKPPPKR